MQSGSSRAVLAAAGAGKTYRIVAYVGKQPSKRFAVVTFTTLNQQKIEEEFWKQWGGVPGRTRIRGWYSFLLEDVIRPYQTLLAWPRAQAKGLNWVEGRSRSTPGKENIAFWFDKSGNVYSDKAAGLAILCDDRADGAVMRRLRLRYDHVLIDEVQDLAGYDLDVVERMLSAGIKITMVGDPRQATFATNQSGRNAKYRGEAIVRKIREWEDAKLLVVEVESRSRRCVQSVCRVADRVFPAYEATASVSDCTSPHDGVFVIRPADLSRYLAEFSPQVLQNARIEGSSPQGLNFGETKGLDFERVVIVPTDGISKWLRTGDIEKVKSGIPRAKLYVAITRAKQSVAFVHDGPTGLGELVRVWPVV